MSTSTTLSAARFIRIVLGAAVSILFLWLLLRGRDISELFRHVRNVRAADLALIAVLLVIGHGARIIRWTCMMRYLGSSIRIRSCVTPYLIGVSLNNMVPFRAGDVYRVLAFGRRPDMARTQVLGTILLERVLDFFVLLTFLAGGTMGLQDADLRSQLMTWLLVTIFIGASIATALIILGRYIAANKFFHPKPSGIVGKFFRHVSSLLGSLVTTFQCFWTPPRVLSLSALSLLAWAITAAIFLVVANAFDVRGHGLESLFAAAAANLAGLLPSSPGSIGTFHYFAAWAFAAYAVPWDAAAALALTVHAVFWLPLTIIGLGLIGWRHIRSSWRTAADHERGI